MTTEDNSTSETMDMNTLWNNGIYGNRIYKKWMYPWMAKIKHQAHFGMILLARLGSTMLMKHRKMIKTRRNTIDPRIPLIYFSPSGSGKGLGSGHYIHVGRQVGLRIHKPMKPTPEKLIGSIDEKKQALNTKKGYTPGDENYKDPRIPGLFEQYDDLIFDEAQIYFNKTEYGENVLRILRLAMDKYGDNELGSDTLKNQDGYKYYCACNSALLSYQIDDIDKQVVSNGIFQRPALFFHFIFPEQMDDILMIPKHNNETYIQTKTEECVEELKKVMLFIQNELPDTIELKYDAEKFINDRILEIRKKSENDLDVQAEITRTFLPRLQDTAVRTAVAFAVLKKKKIAELEDAEEAWYLINIGFVSLQLQLIKYGVVASHIRAWYSDLKRELGKKSYPRKEIYKKMSPIWNIAEDTVKKRINNSELLKFFVEVKPKGSKITLLRLR